MLECVREGRRCNVKFLDADVQRPLASASVVADGKRMWSVSGLKNLIFYENLGARTTKLIHMGLVLAGIWEHKTVDVCPIQRLRIRRQVADMSGKNEQASLDMFLEVENMALDCELAFSGCCSAGGRWNDVEVSEKADFQRGFLQQGARAGGSCLLRAPRCWHAEARVGRSWCSRVQAGLYCSCAARSKGLGLNSKVTLVEQKADTGNYVWCGVREKLHNKEEKREGHWTEEKKNRSRQWGDQRCDQAMCEDRWVQKNECKLFGGLVSEKPVAGLALRSTSCTTVRSGES